jgi:hypothetical protein
MPLVGLQVGSKGAKNHLIICSASDSESDKSNQWYRWSEFFRSVIGAPIDQPPALLANGLPYFFQINLILHDTDN